ncbi:hypothetical protein Acor_74440 [Acrocarpospora corrugata]|uniref:Uncharacterized protein n=1 Tax=Acrocarpospora corrugata TaxID=35763 RepID=A0A5M3W962_9ACTN|nr:hypothetical protein [Acrocarpospora corrugata]GES05376.1 hypothetical protein Acor_74440 [Acrocarpospora corrugata]
MSSQAKAVYGTCAGAADDAEFDHAGGFFDDCFKGRAAVERDAVAFAEEAEDAGGRVEALAVEPDLDVGGFGGFAIHAVGGPGAR